MIRKIDNNSCRDGTFFKFLPKKIRALRLLSSVILFTQSVIDKIKSFHFIFILFIFAFWSFLLLLTHDVQILPQRHGDHVLFPTIATALILAQKIVINISVIFITKYDRQLSQSQSNVPKLVFLITVLFSKHFLINCK